MTELEKSVGERTAQLTTANRRLKREIAGRKRTEALLDGQNRVLEMMAAGAPLSDSLTALIRLIESHVPGMLGSILLLDKQGVHLCHGAAPSLPPPYVAAIDGTAIGPEVGSCGAAAFCKKAVFVEDITTDPRWQNYRAVALPHGLRACWSTPIFDAKGEVLGTFAMYYRHPATPEIEHLRLIERATHIAAIAISRDRVQSELRESEAKLKEAQRLARIGYWERDILADRIIWSEGTCRIFGLKEPDPTLNQAKFEKMIYPEDRPRQRQALDDLLQGGRPYDVEYRIIRPDGHIRFVHVWDEVERDKLGRVIRAFGTVQDITERKQAEALLHAQAQEIRAIVEHSPDIIVRYDRNLRRAYVNPAAVKTFGVPKATLLGKEIASSAREGPIRAAPEEIAILENSLKRAFETRQPIDFESPWPTPSGRRIFAVRLEPEFDGQGELTSILGIGRDITDLKESEAKLRQAQAELARMTRLTLMGELTASIAHEINQPLAAIMTNAEALSRWLASSPPNLEEARDAVRRIVRDSNRAGDVIKKTRRLFKQCEPDRTAVNINKLVRETLALAEPELIREKVSVQTELMPSLPSVPADYVQLQQVLLNLIVNSLDSLGAVIDRPRALRIRTDCPGPDAVQVTVQDTGIGMAPGEKERLFQPFYTTKPDGLGMGLALSRSILEAHGGQIHATPNPDYGVTFQFTLPLQEGGAP